MNPTPQDWLTFIDILAKVLVAVLAVFTSVMGWYVRQIIAGYSKLTSDVAEMQRKFDSMGMERDFLMKENASDHKRMKEDTDAANDRLWMETKSIRLEQQHQENLVEAMRNGMEKLSTQMAVWQSSLERKI